MRTLCFSPFKHTWAEFYIQGQGWTAVDFCAWLYGSRNLTNRNVRDAGLRNEVLAETKLRDAYYFGNLDPYRIHTSARVLESDVSLAYSNGTGLSVSKVQKSIRHCLRVKAERVDGLDHEEGQNIVVLEHCWNTQAHKGPDKDVTFILKP